MREENLAAPGAPGIPPRWTSSAKSGVGTALNPVNHVWFTLSHGIFNEIYYPRVDMACVRDMGLIVTDGQNFFSEEKRHTRSQVNYMIEGIPAYRLTNTCLEERYRVEKEILCDPRRDTVLQQTHFEPLSGKTEDYHLYVLLAPHIGNRGLENNAWIGNYKGVPMLMAEREDKALALACSVPWLKCSAGFVGVSDGWQDLNQHRQMTWEYGRAENGNVALCGEIDWQAGTGNFTLVLGFGTNWAEAGQRALASLVEGYEQAKDNYLSEWMDWQQSLYPLDKTAGSRKERQPGCNLYRTSAAVLRTHEAKHSPGGGIASLSIPWGNAKGDDDLGGYHLVWPRDLVEVAGGLLAAGAAEDARRILYFLAVTQEADGHWPQNMWLDGRPYWDGVQMDESAFPILLVDLANRQKALNNKDLSMLWGMVRRAASFLVKNGPVTQQDRWEEDPGYSPFTLAVEVAAVLSAAELAELNGEPTVAAYLRDTADLWNSCIERWTYVTDTDLARQSGVEGYYVRIAPPEVADASSPASGFVPIKNRPPGESSEPAGYVISPDALALVRFGLRAPDDPRILNTVKVIDTLLKVELPSGPAWHRYNEDGYGEHADGSAFDGTGIGRAWPLLTGERAHFELAAGRVKETKRLLHALESFANEGGMLPEQIWDAPDLPDRELFLGRPSGSAMPLGWAHAEYIKLLRSLRDGSVFDMPPQTVQRYQVKKTDSPFTLWRFNHKCQTIPCEKILRIEVLDPAIVHWSLDGWQMAQDMPAQDSGLGIYVADLPTHNLPAGTKVDFTFFWPQLGKWDGINYTVQLSEG